MIISVDELRKFVTTDMEDAVLEARLQALELSIRKYTNNNFQQIAFRRVCDIVGGLFLDEALTPFEVGETVQISCSGFNNGIYTIVEADDSTFRVEGKVYDERNVMVTKVVYPADVKMGVVDIIKWQLRNEAQNTGEVKTVQSETLSRHSVTYAQDSTESDIDERFGCPRKYMAFLKAYRKARF